MAQVTGYGCELYAGRAEELRFLDLHCNRGKGPHPAFGHLLPFFEREKAKLFGIIAFSRGSWAMGEGAQRADEGTSPLQFLIVTNFQFESSGSRGSG
jgi:hypothetical protein